MSIQGTLETMSLSDLLQFLGSGRKSGTLKFDRGKISKQVYFQNGLIVGSRSNDPREYLGQVLLHYAKVDETQLQLAREAQRRSGVRLGEALIHLGILTEKDVLEVLRIRTLDAIFDLFVWNDGQFQFYDEEPLPADLIKVQVQPTTVIMEGIYRIDELARYKTLVPSDRSILEPGSNWSSSLNVSKELQHALQFVEKRMSVAEICYHMHASSFHVYSLLHDLVSQGFARVAGELPEPFSAGSVEVDDVPGTSDLIRSAQGKLADDPEVAMTILQSALQLEPNNTKAQELLIQAETKFVDQVYTSELSPTAVPRITVSTTDLTSEQLHPQEGFLLSRINGTWDIQSILSICPFREADSLRMMRSLLSRGIIALDS
ncbi:MAG TPA: DUF4388 domain-containing protein [Pyrinomonadaceae bacterium]|nr:DUF4388 domain-containing protein [Pyrinomonadaceae bacterium]